MKPDWDRSPQWARYAAQEISGAWYWHELQPTYHDLSTEWLSNGRREIMPKVEFRPRDTLEERPEQEYAPPDPYDLCAMRETARMRRDNVE